MGPKFSTKGLAGLSHLPHNRRLSLFHFIQTSTEKRFDLLKEIEINPDLWYRSEMLKRELLSTKKLAKFVGANSSNDLIYVDNVTEGINIILKV